MRVYSLEPALRVYNLGPALLVEACDRDARRRPWIGGKVSGRIRCSQNSQTRHPGPLKDPPPTPAGYTCPSPPGSAPAPAESMKLGFRVEGCARRRFAASVRRGVSCLPLYDGYRQAPRNRCVLFSGSRPEPAQKGRLAAIFALSKMSLAVLLLAALLAVLAVGNARHPIATPELRTHLVASLSRSISTRSFDQLLPMSHMFLHSPADHVIQSSLEAAASPPLHFAPSAIANRLQP